MAVDERCAGVSDLLFGGLNHGLADVVAEISAVRELRQLFKGVEHGTIAAAEIVDGYIIEIGVVGQQSNKDLKVALLAFPVTSGDSFVFEAKMFQRTIVIARHRFQNRRSSSCFWSIRFVHLEISPLRLVGRHRNIPNH